MTQAIRPSESKRMQVGGKGAPGAGVNACRKSTPSPPAQTARHPTQRPASLPCRPLPSSFAVTLAARIEHEFSLVFITLHVIPGTRIGRSATDWPLCDGRRPPAPCCPNTDRFCSQYLKTCLYHEADWTVALAISEARGLGETLEYSSARGGCVAAVSFGARARALVR